MIAPLMINESYWQDFSVGRKDIEDIYNLLLEKAIPLPANEILDYVITYRIKHELDSLQKQKTSQGKFYLPKDEYKVGESLSFPAFNLQKGKIKSIRDGLNPDFQEMKVIEVEFDGGKMKSFASRLDDHPLNQVLDTP